MCLWTHCEEFDEVCGRARLTFRGVPTAVPTGCCQAHTDLSVLRSVFPHQHLRAVGLQKGAASALWTENGQIGVCFQALQFTSLLINQTWLLFGKTHWIFMLWIMFWLHCLVGRTVSPFDAQYPNQLAEIAGIRYWPNMYMYIYNLILAIFSVDWQPVFYTWIII